MIKSLFKPTDDFKTIIDKCLTLDYVQSLNGRKYKAVHLSELGGCDREYMFKIKGYRAVPSPEDIRIFGAGHMFHGYLQDTLIQNGIVPETAIERKLKSKIHLIDSSIDVEFMIINGEAVLIDFKTIRVSKHKYDRGGFDNIEGASESHKRQVILYMYYLNNLLKDKPIEWKGFTISKITKAMIAYLRKDGGKWLKRKEVSEFSFDNSFYEELRKLAPDYKLVFQPKKRSDDIKTFWVPYDKMAAKLYVKQVENLSNLIKSGTLPPPNCDDEWYCNNFCMFMGKENCIKAEKELKGENV